MRSFTLSKLCQFIGLSVFSLTLSAAEQPSAESLVGKIYLGAHGMAMKTDEDRLVNNNANSSIVHGSGVGAEVGYRATELFETRISYTHFNPLVENNNYELDSGKSIALDLLYFPFKESFYAVAGADYIDIEESDLSVALGAGYRHYLSPNMALYFEGKGHYQFDNHYTDLSSKIGFIYFFGSEKKAIKRADPVVADRAEPVAATVTAMSAVDSDNDGVIDSQDDCVNTPVEDKVDVQGCTVFSERQESARLSVSFDNNQAIVKEEYKAEIARVANFMNKYPHVNVSIDGYTSAQGSAAYNLKLSTKRAQAIVDILVSEFNIDDTRVEAIGHGETKLLDAANTTEAHKLNRRIEAHLVINEKVAEKRE